MCQVWSREDPKTKAPEPCPVTSIHSRMVYGCFQVTMIELSMDSKDSTVQKGKPIYYLVVNRNRLSARGNLSFRRGLGFRQGRGVTNLHFRKATLATVESAGGDRAGPDAGR